MKLSYLLFLCLPLWAHAASGQDGGTDNCNNNLSVAGLARCETSIALGQTSHFTVPELSCAGDVGKKELWLDGMDTGVRGIGCDADKRMLVFNVSRDGAGVTNKTPDVWLTLLRRPFAAGTSKQFEREVDVSLREDGTVLATVHSKLKLLDKPRAWAGGGILVAVLAMLGFGIFKSGLIRDSGLPPDGNKENRPFSLARLQMVWWFAIVFLSYVVLWLLMQELPSIPASALGLIGMAGGTALAAAALDQGRPVQATKGFWSDISTDADGVTLPRLQQIAWTGLLGIVFLSQVVTRLTMPDFDSSVLALMGISAGAYLGFKVPESHVGDAPATAAPPAADADGKSKYGPTP